MRIFHLFTEPNKLLSTHRRNSNCAAPKFTSIESMLCLCKSAQCSRELFLIKMHVEKDFLCTLQCCADRRY